MIGIPIAWHLVDRLEARGAIGKTARVPLCLRMPRDAESRTISMTGR